MITLLDHVGGGRIIIVFLFENVASRIEDA